MSPDQFKQHILPLKNKMFRFALSYLNEKADAKDVVQEVMLAAWERIQDTESLRNVEAWCMTATKNRALNLLKKKGRNYVQVTEQHDLVSYEHSPLQKAEEKEIAMRIKGIIATLPKKQREVIHLRDLEGYSYKEVMHILGLDMNHVKVLLFRARKQVKAQLTKVQNYGISHAQ